MVSRFRQNLAVSVWRSKNGKTLNEVPCRLKNVCVWGGGGGKGVFMASLAYVINKLRNGVKTHCRQEI